MIAALNGLDIMACDLENAYLNAKCKEKIWFKGRFECGADKVKVCMYVWPDHFWHTPLLELVCVDVCALYGLKSFGASWCATLVQALYNIGFVSTTAGDVWI
jgi:hypothetical protein